MNQPPAIIDFFGKETFQNLTYAEGRCVFDWTIAAGHAVPAHFHSDTDELFEVVEGSLRIRMPEETIILNARERYLIPKGRPHEVKNVGSTIARARVSISPATPRRNFLDVCDFLIRREPGLNGKMALMFKAYYINAAAGNPDFSTPATATARFFFNLMIPPTNLVGRLRGWKTLVKSYGASLKSVA